MKDTKKFNCLGGSNPFKRHSRCLERKKFRYNNYFSNLETEEELENSETLKDLGVKSPFKEVFLISQELKERIYNEIKKEIKNFKQGKKPKSLFRIWEENFQYEISRKHLRNLALKEFPEWYERIWGSKSPKRYARYRKSDKQHKVDIEHIVNNKRGVIKELFRKEKDSEIYFKITCENNHDFTINKSSLKRGSWCPKCNKWRPKTKKEHIADVRKIINAIKGIILDVYRKKEDSNFYFKILCENGHRFEINKEALKRGRWCPICNPYREKTKEEHIADIQNILDNRGWKIIDTYTKGKDSQYYFIIQCKNGHIFHRNKSVLLKAKNPDCPECGPDRSPKLIEEHIANVQGIIKTKGGTLIKTFYKKSSDRNRLKYRIKCKEDHIFSRTKNALKVGSWCPFCQYGKYEAIIIWYFEKILSFVLRESIKFDRRKIICQVLDCKKLAYQIPFKFQHLNINLMHFDGYLFLKINNEIYNLVVEYQGDHHYKFPNRFFKNNSKGKKAFLEVQLRDEFKRWLESKSLIVLFEFPYSIDESMKYPKKIRDFIVSSLRKKLNLNIGRIPEFNHITQSKF